MISRPVSSFILCWDRHLPQRRAALLYKLSDTTELVYPITDYSLYMSDVQLLDSKTVETEITHLKSLIEFLDRNSIPLTQMNDQVLASFRDEEVIKVKSSRNSSSSEKAAQRTVNSKLRRAYQFALWLQEVEQLNTSLIGPRYCQITSTLPNKKSDGKAIQTFFLRQKENFPLLFRNTGSGSRHGLQYEATDEDVALITRYFSSTFSRYVAQRNILMMELARQVSWRRGSINSLTCEQFTKVAFEDFDDDQLLVIPASQKFGYERAFEVPFRLAFQVAEFIATERRELLREHGWSESNAQSRIFLSEKRGTPLSDATLSLIFGHAFRAIGRKRRGANIHSFRRKFANDVTDREIEDRLELGLDTGAQSVASSVAIKMGHKSPESLTPYINSRLSRAARRSADVKERRIQSLEEENRELKQRLAKLVEKL